MTTVEQTLIDTLRQIHGVDPDIGVTSTNRFTFVTAYRRDAGGGEVMLRVEHGWDVLTLGMTVCPTLETTTLRVPETERVLRAWASPGPWDAAHACALGEVMGSIAVDERTYAQLMFTRYQPDPAHGYGYATPERSDGRFAFAGVTEPYPGAWPTAAVLAADHGDLSVLWPYLSCVGDA